MQDNIHADGLIRSPRARLLAAAALVSGLLVAGCGGSSHGPTATTSSGVDRVGVEYGDRTCGDHHRVARRRPRHGARVLRVHAVQRRAQLPRPEARRGSRVPRGRGKYRVARVQERAGEVPEASAGTAAPRVPGSTTHPSAQTMAKLVRIAACMRAHGISQFPDPRTSVPSDPAGYQEITDFDGAILLFPSTINLQSPAYRQDLAACGAPPLGLHH